ncbi:PREDICTED: uncharacterized protein LOC108621705 [Drosophila arizonae]|uniref:Uncharacterized protein LOC108621705 n=1 Tax=Drosophila arizonae TaxID=7263 RepID=A0ABM1Q5C6_DROAR|nr:PREDICTED: uncharacterized protein LOC108621705 [Drosophila arizonae]
MGQSSSKKIQKNKTQSTKNNQSNFQKSIPMETVRNVNAEISPQFKASNFIDSNLVPDWIHKKQFLEILSANVPQFSKIQNFNISPASSAGENYSSLILRIAIDVKLTDKSTKSLAFMMKVPHESAKMQQMLKTVNFFTVENAAYTELIAKFEELYRSIGLDITFAPRAFKFSESVRKEPKLVNTVLMYDLTQDGYRNVNRLECLNVEQTKLVLRKLAQYHAASAQCRSLYGPYPELFTQTMFASNKDRAISILEGIMGPFKKMFLENIYYFKNGDKYYDKFSKLFAKMSSKFLSLSVFDDSEFNVINHGDCWINNLLFKFDTDGNLKDMKFVDFQLPKYGHPSTDLLNFLMSSVHIDYKLTDFDYFIKYYHDQLIEHLKLLKYKDRLPTLSELHMQLYKYGIWAITASVMVLPIVLLDQSEEPMEYKSQLYTNVRYKENIEQIMPWLDNRGLLDL